MNQDCSFTLKLHEPGGFFWKRGGREVLRKASLSLCGICKLGIETDAAEIETNPGTNHLVLSLISGYKLDWLTVVIVCASTKFKINVKYLG